jgi:hypothetical protein
MSGWQALLNYYREQEHRRFIEDFTSFFEFADADLLENHQSLDRQRFRAQGTPSDTEDLRARMTQEGDLSLKKRKFTYLLEYFEGYTNDIARKERIFVDKVKVKWSVLARYDQIYKDCKAVLKAIIRRNLKRCDAYSRGMDNIPEKYVMPVPVHYDADRAVQPVFNTLDLGELADYWETVNAELYELRGLDAHIRDKLITHSGGPEEENEIYNLLKNNLDQQIECVGDPDEYNRLLDFIMSLIDPSR